MKRNSFLQLVGFIFVFKIVIGAFYLYLGWDATLAGWAIPTWFVLIAMAVAIYLAYTAFKLMGKK